MKPQLQASLLIFLISSREKHENNIYLRKPKGTYKQVLRVENDNLWYLRVKNVFENQGQQKANLMIQSSFGIKIMKFKV